MLLCCYFSLYHCIWLYENKDIYTFTFLNNVFSIIKSKINLLQPYVSLADFDYLMKGIPETRRACQIRYLCIITISWHINCTCTTFRFWSINVYLYWGYQLSFFLWFWWNILELFRLWYILFFQFIRSWHQFFCPYNSFPEYLPFHPKEFFSS